MILKMKIKFIPASKDVETFVPKPKPSKLYVPEWYKKTKNFSEKDIKISKDGSVDNSVLKMCQPFLDSMISGYIQETWCDIKIEVKENEVNFFYSYGPQIIDVRKNLSFYPGEEFYPIEFNWFIPWMPRMPKGYSAMFTNALNRNDLSFKSLDGIIDSDKYFHTSFGKYPFFLKKGFDGIIPSGTPMYQIVPIKRETWESETEPYDDILNKKRVYLTRKNFFGNYKKNFWQKKNYY